MKLQSRVVQHIFTRTMSEVAKVTAGRTISNEQDSGRKRTADSRGDHPFPKKPKGKAKKEKIVQQLSDRVDVKRKVALFLMYSGKGYYGIQRQKCDIPTIESELLKALHEVEVIPPEAVSTPQEAAFQRAARTDKGVSAVTNVVSLKMLMIENFVEKINTRLPTQIRVIDCIRTTKSFNCKNYCDGRTYAYLTPTHAFAPKDQLVSTDDYRISDATLEEINRLLQNFKGTHNFHNYTSRVKPTEPNAMRYIISFECGRPFIQRDMEFVIITVRGQSFMLHQIRKMIGITIAIVKGYCEEDVVKKTWQPVKIDVPKAPGLGLMLEKLHYHTYNKRFGSDGMHEPLTCDKHKDIIEKFAKEVIYEDIIKTEKEENSMKEWLQTLPNHSFDECDPNEEQDRYQKLKKDQSTTEGDTESMSSTESTVCPQTTQPSDDQVMETQDTDTAASDNCNKTLDTTGDAERTSNMDSTVCPQTTQPSDDQVMETQDRDSTVSENIKISDTTGDTEWTSNTDSTVCPQTTQPNDDQVIETQDTGTAVSENNKTSDTNPS